MVDDQFTFAVDFSFDFAVYLLDPVLVVGAVLDEKNVPHTGRLYSLENRHHGAAQRRTAQQRSAVGLAALEPEPHRATEFQDLRVLEQSRLSQQDVVVGSLLLVNRILPRPVAAQER